MCHCSQSKANSFPLQAAPSWRMTNYDREKTILSKRPDWFNSKDIKPGDSGELPIKQCAHILMCRLTCVHTVRKIHCHQLLECLESGLSAE